MIDTEQIEQLQAMLSQAESVFVIYGQHPSTDQLASAVSLYSALSQAGKQVTLLAPHAPTSELVERFAPLAKTSTQIGNQNLTISFEYAETAVDKVSYHIGEESGRFYLTIKPKKGEQPLDSSTVEFSYTGAETDLIFLVGVAQLESLGELYVGYEELYQTQSVVAVNSFKPDFGTVHIDTTGTPTMSEAVFSLINQLQLTIDSEAATALMSAIEEVTKGFQSLSTTADTFETVAQLLRIGARRMRKQTVQPLLASTAVKQQQPQVQHHDQKNGSAEKNQDRRDKQHVKQGKANDSAKPGSLHFQPGMTVGKN